MDDLALFRRFAARQTTAFGLWDCCLLCADWYQFKRGDDPADALRGRYSTAIGAMRMIHRHGGLVGLFAAKLEPLGAARLPPERSERGDIVVVEWPDGLNAGVLLGDMVMSAGVERGIIERHLSIGSIVACWRV